MKPRIFKVSWGRRPWVVDWRTGLYWHFPTWRKALVVVLADYKPKGMAA